MARFQFLPWYHNRVPEVDPSRHPPILGEWREGQSDVETAVDMVPWCTSIQTESDDMWGISECDPMPRFQSLPWYHDIVPAADRSRHPPILGEWREGESEGGVAA